METNVSKVIKANKETAKNKEIGETKETVKNKEIGETKEKAKNKEIDEIKETRVAIIGIIVEEETSVEKLNQILHAYGRYVIGRMGLPYRERRINIISVVVDAPQDVISALSGKIGKLPGVSTKAVYSNVISRSGEDDA